MSDRRSVDIDGLDHRTPIPAASRIGPLLVSSVINGFDPGTRDVPPTAAAQIANVFRHTHALLRAEGCDWSHVAKMEFWVPDVEARAAIDAAWLEAFPDPGSRPARHTHVGERAAIVASFLAYLG